MYQWSLKKEIALHLFIALLFFLPFVFIHSLVGLNVLLLYAGVLFGVFLPDIDHFIYALFLKPSEITSQRVRSKIASKNLSSAIDLLFTTRDERKKLIFHNFLFQAFFIVFAFLVVSSTTSLFGRGIVISFLLSLFVDECLDLYQRTDYSRWLRGLPMSLTSQQLRLYLLVQGFLIFLLGYFF